MTLHFRPVRNPSPCGKLAFFMGVKSAIMAPPRRLDWGGAVGVGGSA